MGLFLAGLVVGSLLGVGMMCILVMARSDDDDPPMS